MSLSEGTGTAPRFGPLASLLLILVLGGIMLTPTGSGDEPPRGVDGEEGNDGDQGDTGNSGDTGDNRDGGGDGDTGDHGDGGDHGNRGMEDAVYLEPGVYADLVSSDPDWYAVNTTSAGILRISLWYDAREGSVDLSLLNTTGSELGVSESQSGEERVEVTVASGERYYLRVSNRTGLTYHLAIVNGNARSWIFSVYMAGDNTLHDNMEPDLAEMRETGSGGGLHIPVLKDGSGSRDSKVVYVMPGRDVELPPYVVNQSWGQEVNTGDPATLGDWFAWVLLTFDTGGRTALDLWNHGNGVWGACWDSNSGNDILTLADIRTGIERAMVLAGNGEAGNGSDGRSGDGSRHGSPGPSWNGSRAIELLGSDACLMQVLELPYEVRGLASFYIASQEDEPLDGWDYGPVLRELAGNLSWDGEQLGRSIIRWYFAEYGHGGKQTLSVVDVRNITRLSDALADLARYLGEDLDRWADEVRMARTHTQEYNHVYVDILDFLRNLEQRTDNGTILSLVAQAAEETDRVVLHEDHGAKRSGSNGLSVYFPRSGSDYRSDYDRITFSVDTWWGEFLGEWMATGGGPSVWFDRVLAYPRDNDSHPGNDTVLVMVKPFTDREEQNVTVVLELVQVNGTGEDGTEGGGTEGDGTGHKNGTRDTNPTRDTNRTGPRNLTVPLTIHGKEAVFIHLYLPLSGGDGTPAGYYRVRASLYDSEGNRDDIWMSDPLYLHPYDDTPPLPHPPSISLHGTGQPLMVHGNSSLELAVTVYAGVPDSFAWDLNGDGETDVITPAGFLVHTFGEPGTYHVSVTAADAWNRTDTAGVVVRVNALPVFTDGYGSLPVRMNPGPVDIRLNVTDPDGEILWYAWTLDGEPVWSGSDPSRQLAGVTIGIPGNHTLTLTVTDSDGGTASRSITVRVNAPPRITDITLERIPGHPLMDTVWVRFTAEARDDHGEIVAYHWDPDGSERYHITTRENTLMALVEPGILHWGVTVVDDLGLGTVRRAAEDITMDPGIFLMTLDGVIIEGDTMIWPGDGPLSLVVVARGSFPPGADGLELTVSFDGTIIHRELVRRPQPGTGGQGVIREDMVVTVDGPPRDGVLDIGMLGSETDVRRELNVTGDRGRTGDGSPGPGGSVPHLTAVWFVAACAGGLVLRRHSRRRMVHDRGR